MSEKGGSGNPPLCPDCGQDSINVYQDWAGDQSFDCDKCPWEFDRFNYILRERKRQSND
jgi:transposase-like protein